MLVITVKLLPPSSPDLGFLINALRGAVEEIPELELDRTQVTVCLDKDLEEDSLGEELIAFIDGLTDTPARTMAVKERLVNQIKGRLAAYACHHLRKCKFVEVFLRPHEATGRVNMKQ